MAGCYIRSSKDCKISVVGLRLDFEQTKLMIGIIIREIVFKPKLHAIFEVLS